MLVKETEVGKNIAQLENSADKYTEKELSRLYQLEVEKLGAQYFPEYAEKDSNLTVYNAMSVCDNGLGKAISSETKQISQTESLSYTEYSSGRASLIYQKTWGTPTTSTAVSGGIQYKRNLYVTVNGCYGSVFVTGLTYTINLNHYDWIDDVGTCTDNSGMTVASISKRMEDAGGDAVAYYAGNVEDMKWSYTISISYTVHVGKNSARVYDMYGYEV